MLNNLFLKKDPSIIEDNELSSISEWVGEKDLEGELPIDVYQTPREIVIKSTIAGIKPEDLKISLHHDLLTIKGQRKAENNIKEEDYFYKECYFGSFSRSIILPAEVDSHQVDAVLENGLLIITLQKTHPSRIEIKTKN
ncbi:MAG: Hsp20/alpha crystallin family protein [Candidatus Falkowbacteria bacterium]